MATGTKKVDKDAEAAKAQDNDAKQAVSENVSNLLTQVGELDWEERQAFSRRFNEVLNQENDKRSQGLDFDGKDYK